MAVKAKKADGKLKKKTVAKPKKKTDAGSKKKADGKKDNGKAVTFSVIADKGSSVYVAGTFNGWNEEVDKLSYGNGKYSVRLCLEPGRHEYKFIIDGAWHADPECHEWSHNDLGSVNSVIFVD